jgi:hypothetical protein
LDEREPPVECQQIEKEVADAKVVRKFAPEEVGGGSIERHEGGPFRLKRKYWRSAYVR